MVKTELIKIARKLIFWDKSLNIYANGEGNDYPERHERLRNRSVTASMGLKKMLQFVIGLGFGKDIDELMVGRERFIDIAEDIARDICNERGVFVHVNINANYEIDNWKVLPFKSCRLGKKDDSNYNGKILVYEDWNSEKIDKRKVRVYDVFNMNPKVIETQVRKAKGWKRYKGQILYFNMDRQYFYPLSRIDSVELECDNEYLASVFKNRTLRTGFFGKTLIVTRPLVGQKMKDNKTDEGRRALRAAETEREEFRANLGQFIGVQEDQGVMHVEADFAGQKLEEAFLIKNIESNINDKMFEFTENSASLKILMACNNLPSVLVKNPDSAMFGTSGEGLHEAKKSYQENTSIERSVTERIINTIYSKSIFYDEAKKVDLKIIKLIKEDAATEPTNN